MQAGTTGSSVLLWSVLETHAAILNCSRSTQAFVLSFTILFTVSAAHGGSRHTYYLSPHEMQLAIKYNYIANVLIVVPLCTGKISVALLIQRLLAPGAKYQRWFLYFVSTSLSIVITFVIIVILCQCRPVESLWDSNITGSCWDPDIVGNWNFFAGSKSIVSSVNAQC
jgi:hypothetical protein